MKLLSSNLGGIPISLCDLTMFDSHLHSIGQKDIKVFTARLVYASSASSAWLRKGCVQLCRFSCNSLILSVASYPYKTENVQNKTWKQKSNNQSVHQWDLSTLQRWLGSESPWSNQPHEDLLIARLTWHSSNRKMIWYDWCALFVRIKETILGEYFYENM